MSEHEFSASHLSSDRNLVTKVKPTDGSMTLNQSSVNTKVLLASGSTSNGPGLATNAIRSQYTNNSVHTRNGQSLKSDPESNSFVSVSSLSHRSSELSDHAHSTAQNVNHSAMNSNRQPTNFGAAPFSLQGTHSVNPPSLPQQSVQQSEYPTPDALFIALEHIMSEQLNSNLLIDNDLHSDGNLLRYGCKVSLRSLEVGVQVEVDSTGSTSLSQSRDADESIFIVIPYPTAKLSSTIFNSNDYLNIPIRACARVALLHRASGRYLSVGSILGSSSVLSSNNGPYLSEVSLPTDTRSLRLTSNESALSDATLLSSVLPPPPSDALGLYLIPPESICVSATVAQKSWPPARSASNGTAPTSARAYLPSPLIPTSVPLLLLADGGAESANSALQRNVLLVPARQDSALLVPALAASSSLLPPSPLRAGAPSLGKDNGPLDPTLVWHQLLTQGCEQLQWSCSIRGSASASQSTYPAAFAHLPMSLLPARFRCALRPFAAAACPPTIAPPGVPVTVQTLCESTSMADGTVSPQQVEQDSALFLDGLCNALMGLPGTLFAAVLRAPRDREFWDSAASAGDFGALQALLRTELVAAHRTASGARLPHTRCSDPQVLALVERLVPFVNSTLRVRVFSLVFARTAGRTCFALSTALRALLRELDALLARIEAIRFESVGGAQKKSMTHITPAQVWYYLQPASRTMALLEQLMDAVYLRVRKTDAHDATATAPPAAAIVNALQEAARSLGDPAARQICSFLLKRVCRPSLAFVDSFVLSGTLQDPCSEFFIFCEESPLDAARDRVVLGVSGSLGLPHSEKKEDDVSARASSIELIMPSLCSALAHSHTPNQTNNNLVKRRIALAEESPLFLRGALEDVLKAGGDISVLRACKTVWGSDRILGAFLDRRTISADSKTDPHAEATADVKKDIDLDQELALWLSTVAESFHQNFSPSLQVATDDSRQNTTVSGNSTGNEPEEGTFCRLGHDAPVALSREAARVRSKASEALMLYMYCSHPSIYSNSTKSPLPARPAIVSMRGMGADVLGKLSIIRRALLCAESDWISTFLESAASELNKPVNPAASGPASERETPASLARLTAAFENAFVQGRSPETVSSVANTLHVQFASMSLLQQVLSVGASGSFLSSLPSAIPNASPVNLKGYSVFELSVRVEWPACMVITPSSCLRYSLLFRHLFLLHFTLNRVAAAWQPHQLSRAARGQIQTSLRAAQLLRARMHLLLSHLLFFFGSEVIEPAWLDLRAALLSAGDISEARAAHSAFVANVESNTLLAPPIGASIRGEPGTAAAPPENHCLKALSKLMSLCILFSTQMSRSIADSVPRSHIGAAGTFDALTDADTFAAARAERESILAEAAKKAKAVQTPSIELPGQDKPPSPEAVVADTMRLRRLQRQQDLENGMSRSIGRADWQQSIEKSVLLFDSLLKAFLVSLAERAAKEDGSKLLGLIQRLNFNGFDARHLKLDI